MGLRARLICALVAGALSLASGALGAPSRGRLDPPGPPEPTEPLVEPRTAISELPFLIDSPGSYHVTQSLAASVGIIVDADDVTIDLNGFTLTAIFVPVGAFPPGGIVAGPNGGDNVVVRNGRLVEWQGDSIRLGTGAVIEDLIIRDGASDGIEAGPESRVSRCRVDRCGQRGLVLGDHSLVELTTSTAHGLTGIEVGTGSVVRDSVSYFNEVQGIVAGRGATVQDCTTRGNSEAGIEAGTGSVVSGCAADENSGNGIDVAIGVTVESCAASNNTGTGIFTASACTVIACSAYGNGEDGIHTGINSSVLDCTSSFNTGDGIDIDGRCQVVNNKCASNGFSTAVAAGVHAIGGQNRIEGNSLTINDMGIQTDAGDNIIVRNMASGAGQDHYGSIAGSANRVGPIITAIDISGVTSPWANFVH